MMPSVYSIRIFLNHQMCHIVSGILYQISCGDWWWVITLSYGSIWWCKNEWQLIVVFTYYQRYNFITVSVRKKNINKRILTTEHINANYSWRWDVEKCIVLPLTPGFYPSTDKLIFRIDGIIFQILKKKQFSQLNSHLCVNEQL